MFCFAKEKGKKVEEANMSEKLKELIIPYSSSQLQEDYTQVTNLLDTPFRDDDSNAKSCLFFSVPNELTDDQLITIFTKDVPCEPLCIKTCAIKNKTHNFYSGYAFYENDCATMTAAKELLGRECDTEMKGVDRLKFQFNTIFF